jgi:membrane protein YdbS with pleckstrin-like domain
MNQNENQETPPGLASRVVVSIIVFFGLLICAIVYVAFFAASFSLFQKIAIILVAILIATAILGAMWTSWGIKYGREWKDKGCK